MGLVKDIQDDLEKATIQMVVEYRARLLGDAVKLCGNQTDAEDLVGTVFKEFLTSADGYDAEKGDLYSYLHGILVHVQARTKRRAVDRGTIAVDPSVLAQDETLSTECTNDEIFAHSDHDALRMAINRLPKDYRDAVLLHYFSELPLVKVARILGVSEGTVKWRLNMARKALAGDLGKALGKKPMAILAAVLLAGSLFGAVAWGVAAARTFVEEQSAAASKTVPSALSPTGAVQSTVPSAFSPTGAVQSTVPSALSPTGADTTDAVQSGTVPEQSISTENTQKEQTAMNTIVKAASAALLSVGSAFLPQAASAGTWTYNGNTVTDGNWTWNVASWTDDTFTLTRTDQRGLVAGSGVMDLSTIEEDLGRKMTWSQYQFTGASYITGIVFPSSVAKSETSFSFPYAALENLGVTELDFSSFKSAVGSLGSSTFPSCVKLTLPEAQATVNFGGSLKFRNLTEIYVTGGKITSYDWQLFNTTAYQIRLYVDPGYDEKWAQGVSAITDTDRADQHYTDYGLAEVEAAGNLLGTIAPNGHGKFWVIKWDSPFKKTGFRISGKVTNAAGGSIVCTPEAEGNFYAEGTDVTVTAVPNAGCHFVRWIGEIPAGVSETAASFVVKATENKEYLASFAFDDGWHKLSGMQITDGNFTLNLQTWEETTFSLYRADQAPTWYAGGQGTLDLKSAEKSLGRTLTLASINQFINATVFDRIILPKSMEEATTPTTFPSGTFQNTAVEELDFSRFAASVSFTKNDSLLPKLEKIIYPVSQESIVTGNESRYPLLTEAYMAGKAFSSITYKGFNTTDYQVRVYIDPTMDKKWNKDGKFGGAYKISAITDTDRADQHYADYGLAEVEAAGDLLGTMKPNSNGRMWIIRWTSPAKRPGMKLIFK